MIATPLLARGRAFMTGSHALVCGMAPGGRTALWIARPGYGNIIRSITGII